MLDLAGLQAMSVKRKGGERNMFYIVVKLKRYCVRARASGLGTALHTTSGLVRISTAYAYIVHLFIRKPSVDLAPSISLSTAPSIHAFDIILL